MCMHHHVMLILLVMLSRFKSTKHLCHFLTSIQCWSVRLYQYHFKSHLMILSIAHHHLKQIFVTINLDALWLFIHYQAESDHLYQA